MTVIIPPNSPPPWMEDNTYPFLVGATGSLWAWQFLRRKPLYRQLWEKEIAVYPRFKKVPIGEDVHEILYHQHEVSENGPDNTLVDYRAICIATNDTERGSDFYMTEFGIRLLIDPAQECPDRPLLEDLFGTERVHSVETENVWLERKDIHLYDVPAEMAVYLFDLSQEIRPQLEDARSRLLQEQKAFAELADRAVKRDDHRPPWSLLQTYIWLLDAEGAEMSRQDMRHIIYGDNPITIEANDRKVAKQIHAAQGLRNGSYRHLLNSMAH